MNGRVYLRAIVPIGLFFSLSLICGNLTYLYLSVSFIQMIKATTPVATLGNVSFIVIGVIIASFGEIQFVVLGFLLQVASIIFEAIRLTMVQRLLSSAEFKMDPLVSLYYFAPAYTVDFDHVGYFTLLLNAIIAFGLNVSVVFLIGRTSSLEYAGGAGRAWADYGVRHPALKKLIVFSGVLLVLFLLLGSFSSSLPIDPKQYVGNKYTGFFGNGGVQG
ncbi:DUF250 domain membrane protein, partial [Aureobasidium melanogenum]